MSTNQNIEYYGSRQQNQPPKKRKKKKRGGLGLFFLFIFIVILVIGGYIAFNIWGPNTGDMHKGQYLYIPTGASYTYVKDELEDGGYVHDIFTFDLLAKELNYDEMVKPGRYKIPYQISNLELIRMLRSGRQKPVNLVINKVRTKSDFARLVSGTLEPDSAEMMKLLNNDGYLQKHGFDTSTALAAIIPDTYEFYWNANPESIYSRLVGYYEKFWTEEKKQQAYALNLTPTQVMILASIVEEETNKADEKPTIASVYLNRLDYNMKLQADPTVKFAMQDFELKRILNVHLEHESLYNTYKYAGLPPGLICTPSKESINAVLNPEDTDYLYFCAKDDLSGYHSFASDYVGHMKNARAYQKALNERGIK